MPTMLNLQTMEDILIPVPWGNIRGKTTGNPNGQKVLVVHGWMDNCGTFDLLLPLLFDSFYLVFIDLPGHGLSSHIPPGIPYHNFEYVVAIRRVVRYLKWTKYDYIGHSLGAAIGSMYAAIFPSEIERLVMIDYVKMLSCSSESTRTEYSVFSREFMGLDRQKSGNISTIGYPLKKLSDLYLQVTGGALNNREADILLKRGATRLEPNADKWTFTRDPRVRNPGLMRFSHEGTLSILSSIRSELLLMQATNSGWVEPQKLCDETIELYKKHCKSFKLEKVPGNHFVPLTNPSAVAPPINRFLFAGRD